MLLKLIKLVKVRWLIYHIKLCFQQYMTILKFLDNNNKELLKK